MMMMILPTKRRTDRKNESNVGSALHVPFLSVVQCRVQRDPKICRTKGRNFQKFSTDSNKKEGKNTGHNVIERRQNVVASIRNKFVRNLLKWPLGGL